MSKADVVLENLKKTVAMNLLEDDGEKKIVGKWSTTGGRYTIILYYAGYRSGGGQYDIEELENGRSRAMSVGLTKDEAQEEIARTIDGAARIDKIKYKKIL